MNKNFPTYLHKEGKVLAFFDGKIIAEGNDFAKVEETAVTYLDSLNKHHEERAEEAKRESATSITTPNGLTGKILNRVDGVWGQKEMTVRLENGRVAKFVVTGKEQYSNERTASTSDSLVGVLRQELDESYGQDRASLTRRVATLQHIADTAKPLLASGNLSYSEQQELDKIVLEASIEGGEVNGALDYLKQADAVAPTAPFGYKAVEQAELGRGPADNWLGKTAEDMVKEVEGIDYDKVLNEEPALFAAELETGTLADQGSTAQMAMSHIIAKTAAFIGPDVEDYRKKFVDATEVARKIEYASREKIETVQKEAKTTPDAPDEALFW